MAICPDSAGVDLLEEDGLLDNCDLNTDNSETNNKRKDSEAFINTDILGSFLKQPLSKLFQTPFIENGTLVFVYGTPESEPESQCRVEIALGDITQEHTETIVHSTNENIDFNGEVGKKLAKLVGPQHVAELRKMGLGVDATIRTTSAPEGKDLTFSRITHVNVHKYTHQKEGFVQRVFDWFKRYFQTYDHKPEEFKSTFMTCFKQAENLALASLSMPLIGTGSFGAPVDVLADGFLRALVSFLLQHYKELHLIRIVIIDPHKCRVFQDAIVRLLITRQTGDMK